MGFFDRSSSSSQTTNVTETIVPTAGASDESLSIAAVGDVHFLDAGSIEAAFRFASESLGVVDRVATRGQAGQEKALEKSLEAVAQSVDEAQSGGAQRLLYFGIAALSVAGLLIWKGGL